MCMGVLARIKEFLRTLADYILLFFRILLYVIFLGPIIHLIVEIKRARRTPNQNDGGDGYEDMG